MEPVRRWGRAGAWEGEVMRTRKLEIRRASLVFATDLDGTFADGPEADRACLQALLGTWPGALLIYATGRSAESTRRLMAEASLPEPDVLIADVGTTVVQGGRSVGRLARVLGRDWPGGTVVRGRLADLDCVREQSVRAPRRVSYELERGALEAAVPRVRRRLAGLSVDVVASAGRYVDVLPAGVNKGSTLRRVVGWLGASGADVVVAGDSLNDQALFEAGYRGIVVGNCESALRARVGSLDGVYCARGVGAAGILEGLIHFGWLEETDEG